MQHIVLIIHIILAVALVIVVLLQRSEGAGLAGPSASGMMPMRGAANLLTRTTAILAGGFMLTSLTLAVLAGHQKPRLSLAESIAAEQQQGQGAPVSDVPVVLPSTSPSTSPPSSPLPSDRMPSEAATPAPDQTPPSSVPVPAAKPPAPAR